MCDGYNYNNMHKNETKSHGWLMIQFAMGCNIGVLVNKTQNLMDIHMNLSFFHTDTRDNYTKIVLLTLKITSQSKTGPKIVAFLCMVFYQQILQLYMNL